MSRRGSTLLTAASLAVFLALGGSLLPVPYVELGPGPTYNTLGEAGGRPLIEISGHPTYPTTGHLNLTTVAVTPGRLGLGTALRGWFDPQIAVVPRELIYPPGRSERQVEADNTAQMRESQQHATTAALRQLGIPVTTTVTVAGVSPDSPAQGRLQPGDVIASVDGTPVADPDQLRQLIGRRAPGESVQLEVRRGGTTSALAVPTVPAPDDRHRPVIGVSPGEEPQYPFTVDIRLEDVGGPSAGLLFALGIIDKLTPEDITHGAFVAGTGTISDDGRVGPVGGVRQKVIAAREHGASVFLIPPADCADARGSTPAGLRLVRVDTLAGALEGLRQLGTPGAGTPPSCPN